MIRLRDRSRNYILEHFERVSVQSESILKLNIDDLLEIVSDKQLNIKDERIAWECVVKWIDFMPEKRAVHLTKLMRAVKLGLLTNEYFMEKVKTNHYVEKDPEAKPIIIETMKFLCDLEMMPLSSSSLKTPSFAVPRIPHEVILAIGGWSEGAPQTHIESYDSRADRWVRVFPEDPSGPRSYHGTAVLGTKVYCIGGFNGTDYFNTCTRFDAVKRTWKEIAPMHSRRCYVSVASLNGMIYALGGYDGNHVRELFEKRQNVRPLSLIISTASELGRTLLPQDEPVDDDSSDAVSAFGCRCLRFRGTHLHHRRVQRTGMVGFDGDSVQGDG